MRSTLVEFVEALGRGTIQGIYQLPAMVSITFQPKISFTDEPVTLKVANLLKRQRVTLVSRQRNQRGKVFHSWASYEANEEGVVDLQTDEAVDGFYKGVHPMGLFWSMKRRGFSTLIKSDTTIPDMVSISVLDGHHDIGMDIPRLSNFVVLAATEVERHYIDPAVRRISICYGDVRGVLFLPVHKGEVPGIIDIGGVKGGVTEGRGALIARRGFAVLCLSLFGLPDQPKYLPVVDLEVIERAVHFLQSQDEVAGTGVGIIGLSYGGTIVLAAGACIPDIKCVVNVSGPVFAINQANFKFKGKVWKHAVSDVNKVKIENGMRCTEGATDIPSLKEVDDHMPDFHKCKASILFQYGGEDAVLNVDKNIQLARSRFETSGKKNYKFRVYPGAGHVIYVPNTPLVSAMFLESQHKHPTRMGGRVLDHAKAQEVAWQDVFDFFSSNLSSLSSHL